MREGKRKREIEWEMGRNVFVKANSRLLEGEKSI